MDEISTLYDGRKVQKGVISDSTGRAKLSLWEENITLVELQNSYSFTNLTVKPYNGYNSLFTPRSGFKVVKIDHVDQALPLLESIKKTKTLHDAHIVAVTNFSNCVYTVGRVILRHSQILQHLLNVQTATALALQVGVSCTYQLYYILLQILLNSNRQHQALTFQQLQENL